jgi:DNA-directed RNA polymerase subunit H
MCSEVLDSMMRARGATRLGDSPLTYESPTTTTHVFRMERLTVGALRETVLAAAKGGSSCLIVVDAAPSAVVRQAIAECAQSGVRIEIFTSTELQFDVMRHALQPKYEVLSAAETAALLTKYKLKLAQLPRLLSRDVCARYLALGRGDVVRITRAASGQDAYSTYRVVV